MGRGLEFIAGKAGGALFRVEAGNGNFVFDRVLRETTGTICWRRAHRRRPRRQTALHSGRRKKGATVRARTQVVIPRIRPASSATPPYSALPSFFNSALSPVELCVLAGEPLAERPRDRDVHRTRMAFHVRAVGGLDAHARKRSVDPSTSRASHV